MPKVNKRAAGAELLAEAGGMEGIEAGVEEPAAAAAAAHAGPSGSAPRKPKFAPLSAYEQNGQRIEFRRIPVPQHRMTPLKNAWLSLYKPVTENLKLDMRMNLKSKMARGARGDGALWARAAAARGAPGQAPTLTPPPHTHTHLPAAGGDQDDAGHARRRQPAARGRLCARVHSGV